jgi:23S rRNA (pseudouridine1915-N3)-methyltransferase
MKFRLIWVRSNADAEFSVAIDRYLARVRHFYPVEVTEIAPERGRQSESDVAIMRAESARLLAAIPSRGYTVVLDERGQTFDSLKFSKWLERLTIDQPHGVSFVMGGDIGLGEPVKQRADTLLSLSAMTLPHQIARVVLLEQIYRACTLMRNIPYHK